MNEEDKKYLRSVKKVEPSFEVFSRMSQILKSIQKKSDQLLDKLNGMLLEPPKTT